MGGSCRIDLNLFFPPALAWLGASAGLELAATRARALGARAPARSAALPVPAPAVGRGIELGFLGDLQRGVSDVPLALARALGKRPVDLLISTGDLAEHGEAPWHALVAKAFDRAGLPVPFRAVPGNHDLYPSRCRDDRIGGPHFERFWGPRSWACDLGPVLLIGLDTGASWRAAFELPALRAFLATHPTKPWILATHRPPYRFDLPQQPVYDDMGEVVAWLQERPPALCVAGHLHEHREQTVAGVPYVVNAKGGDVGGGERRRNFHLLRVRIAVDGTLSWALESLARRRDVGLVLDRFALRLARARRTPIGQVVRAPAAALLRLVGASVPVVRHPLRRAYPTRAEAYAWWSEERAAAGKPRATSAIVLAGGHGSRMGRDKAGLRVATDAPTLLASVLGTLADVVDETIVVARRDQVLGPLPAGVRLVHDDIEGLGPLGGLAAGLAAATHDHVFATSCDVPFLRRAFVAEMLEQLGDRRLAAPHALGRTHPLPMAVHRRVEADVRALLANGRRRVGELLERLDAHLVDEATLRKFDPDLVSLVDVDDPAALAAAARLRPVPEGTLGFAPPLQQRLACRRVFVVGATVRAALGAALQRLPALAPDVLDPEARPTAAWRAHGAHGEAALEQPLHEGWHLVLEPKHPA